MTGTLTEKTLSDYLESIRGYGLPGYMASGIYSYVEHHIPAAGFLSAILSNDLMEAYKRADSDNIKCIQGWVEFLYQEAPLNCWGSPEKVKEWLSRGKEQRQ